MKETKLRRCTYMTKINGSDAMLKVIYDWGIDHIYGFPGG